MPKANNKIRVLYFLSFSALIFSVSALFFVFFVYFLDQPSFLKNDVTQTNVSLSIRAGSLQFTRNPNPSLNQLNASVDVQTSTGTLSEIEVTDLRGSHSVGWTVNLDSITDYISGDRNYRIPLTNTAFTVSSLNVVSGDSRFVSVPTGTLRPADANNDGISDSAITLSQTMGQLPTAPPGTSTPIYRGVNRVRFTPNINLTVPGQLPAQSYTSIYTLSIQ